MSDFTNALCLNCLDDEMCEKKQKTNQTGLTLSKIIHRGAIALLSHREVL